MNFQGQIWNLLYLSQKWSDCHETKSKHIDWTLDLRCDHWVWPWPWPWPWIFKIKYGICYISGKNSPITTKRKANISIGLKASHVTNGFDLGCDLDLWIFKVKCDLDLWQHSWLWSRIFMVKFWNSCISEWEDWLTLYKGGRSKSFMTMTGTIWSPRSGVRIYQIVTGVTSDVGVSSNHLVRSVDCDVTGTLWGHQKAVSCRGWDKLISETQRLSLTPGCTKQINLRPRVLVSYTHVYKTTQSPLPPCGLVVPYGNIELGQHCLR